MESPHHELTSLYAARDLFEDTLRSSTRESDFQALFKEYPQILSTALPLKVAPSDIQPLGRPGRSDPDFLIFPERGVLGGNYGVIELKRPSSHIVTRPRKGVIQLSRDAQTAVSQGLVYGEQLQPFIQAQRAIVLGTDLHIFVIIGMSEELAERVATDLHHKQMGRLLPPSCQLIPYDTLLKRFEAALPPKLVVLVPALDRLPDRRLIFREVIAIVRERGLVRHGVPLVLASGVQSREYIDPHQVLSTGQALETVASAACAVLRERDVEFDVVGALDGHQALALGIAVNLGVEWFVIDRRTKPHAGERRVSGAVLHEGRRAVLVDDVVTTGRHLEVAIDATIAAGAQVTFALAMVDRGMRAEQLLSAKGVRLESLCTYADLEIEPV